MKPAWLALVFSAWLAHAAAAQVVNQTGGVDQAARAALPDAIRSAGTLQVATSLQWPPFDYKAENGQPEGIDISIVTGIAGKLGLTPHFTDVKFPAIVPGVSSGRFDIGVDELAETPERQKIVRFVRYYKGGLGLLVRQGTQGIDVNHLCGHALALTQGSSQVAIAQHVSDQCVKDGQKAIAFLFFPDSADTYLAVANGRGDGFLTDRAVGVYVARHNGKLVMTPGTLEGTVDYSGIVLAKDNATLAKAVRLALIGMMQDGSYQKILDRFGVGDAAVTPADLPPD